MIGLFRSYKFTVAALALALSCATAPVTADTVYAHRHEADEQEQDSLEQREHAANDVSWRDAETTFYRMH